MCGFCNVRVCMCGFCNVWVCVCVGFVMCGCVCVGLSCVGVCVCWFCNVCVCVGFVMCGCVYVWVFACAGVSRRPSCRKTTKGSLQNVSWTCFRRCRKH